MNAQIVIGMAAAFFLLEVSAVAVAADRRHSPDAHMDQNADRYRYDYDDGVCNYHYEFDFKQLTDHLEQRGDCRDVPIQRYRPQAAIAPAYPPPASVPPAVAPAPAGVPAPGLPAQPPPGARAPNGPSGIVVTPLQ